MSQAVNLKPGQSLSLPDRVEKIGELRELIERGYMSLSEICKVFGVSLATASQWRKAAMMLIATDDDGYTRDSLRRIQTGRILYKIEALERDLEACEGVDERLRVHDRLIKYYDALARITGLNSETINVEHKVKPLTINMPTIEEAEIKAT